MAGKNYRCQPLAETELRKFREFLFQPVRTEKLEYLAPPEVRPFVLKTFLWNRVFSLHLNRSNWKFCLNGKRPSIIGITGRPPDFGPQNSSWENNTIFISLIYLHQLRIPVFWFVLGASGNIRIETPRLDSLF